MQVFYFSKRINSKNNNFDLKNLILLFITLINKIVYKMKQKINN